ncbi:hypothetical protein DAMA08_013240 [Martiniozyma asiatica (nom. inval.)]|nr:hypothetical protein DAMA08_013240 [Martiniozyma asiatica]
MHNAGQFQDDITTILVILESMKPNLKRKFLNDVVKWAKLRYHSMDSEHYWKLFRDYGVTPGESLSPTKASPTISKSNQRLV